MFNCLAHFAIEADDVDRARLFYQSVFGWVFEPWGPPGFYLIEGAGVHAALQGRNEPLPKGRKGFECSFAVENLTQTAQTIEDAGGTLLGGAQQIPTVGQLQQFLDTEGNQAIIIQYEPDQAAALGIG